MEFNATFLVSIFSFIIFVFMMNKVLYEPMNKIVAQRQSFVDENLRLAEENRKEAKVITEEKEEKLRSARNDAKSKYAMSVSEYKNKKSEMVNNAQKVAQDELADAYNNLNNLSNETKEALKGKMIDLANDISEKMLGYRSEIQGFDGDMVNKILY